MPFNYAMYNRFFLDLYYTKKFEDLNTLINQALEIKNNWYGWYRYALFLKQIGNTKNAWDVWSHAIKLSPNHKVLYDLQFIELALEAKKFKEAEKLVKNYIKLVLSDSFTYLFAGKFYNAFNKKTEALEYYNKGIFTSKVHDVLHKDLYKDAVLFFLQEKRFEEATTTLKKIAEFDPFDLETKGLLLQIKNTNNQRGFQSPANI